MTSPPDLRSADLYRGAVPFIVLQLLVALLVVAFPNLAFEFGPPPGRPMTADEVERVLEALP